jgi:4-diphosphocytidyl-2-C-methyl-D-erythritol kinase
MTGTGSCIFAEFHARKKALTVQNQISISLRSFVVRGKNYSPVHKSIKKFAGIYKN